MPYCGAVEQLSQTHVERAYGALHAKQAPYSLLFNYYAGAQPLQYTVDDLAKVFKNLTAKWTENWCKVVVDSLLDRMTLTGFSAEDEKVKTALETLWTTKTSPSTPSACTRPWS